MTNPFDILDQTRNIQEWIYESGLFENQPGICRPYRVEFWNNLPFAPHYVRDDTKCDTRPGLNVDDAVNIRVAQRPQVSSPPKRIYASTTDAFSQSVQSTNRRPIPVMPERRLKALSATPDTQPTQDRPTPVLTVEQAISQRTYGSLLHEPITNTELKLPSYSGGDFAAQFTQDQGAAREARAAQDAPAHDLALVLISPGGAAPVPSHQSFVFGLDGLASLNNFWVTRSYAGEYPIVTQIHPKTRFYQIQGHRTPAPNCPAILQGIGDGDLTERIYKILGGDQWFSNLTEDPQIIRDPEQLLRARIQDLYEESTQGISSTTLEIASLPELIIALEAVNHLRSGQWRFPDAVADSIVKVGDQSIVGDLSEIFSDSTRQLSDIQDFNQWQLEQFDAVVGDWHKEFLIEDTDLEEEGNQPKRVVLPNMSEALTDILAQIMVANVSIQALLNMGSRTLIEASTGKKESIQTQKTVDALLDYFGPETKDEVVEVPILCTLKNPESDQPSEAELAQLNRLSKFLEPSIKKVPVPIYTGKKTFQFDLQRLIQASDIIRAALSRALPDDQAQAARHLRDLFKLAEDAEGEDFSAFLEQVERGFGETPGISNPANPYGRDFDQRPKIKEVGNSDDQ